MIKIGNGSFIKGDCLEVMKNIPSNSIDMVLCDLPYGTTCNKWDNIIPLDILWKHYNRVCKVNAIIALTASQPFTSILTCSNLTMFKHEWIWIKNRGSNFANTVREPFKEHESILVFSKGKWTYNKQMQERTGGGINMAGYVKGTNNVTDNFNKFRHDNTDFKHKPLTKLRLPSSWQKFNTHVKGFHPTQKPVGLFEYLVKTYSNEGMTILDNCAGSGTTAIACENLQRKWICIEKDEIYYNKAVERIKDHLNIRSFHFSPERKRLRKAFFDD